jgi:hypothetical protein
VELTTLLLEAFKSGKVTISQNNDPQLEIKAQNGNIDINATDKKLIKQVVSSAREGTSKGGIKERIQRTTSTIREARQSQPLVKAIVEDLCREGVTITFSYKGDRVATIGSEANSKLTRLVTGTKGIEINSPRKLAELGL